jgi:hypothetical protein
MIAAPIRPAGHPSSLLAAAVLFSLAASCGAFAPGAGASDDSEPGPGPRGGGPGRPDFVAFLDASQTVAPSGSSATAVAQFWYSHRTRSLRYRIEIDGLDLTRFQTCGFPIPGCNPADTADDVTNIHIHSAPRGADGPHALNVYLGPSDDDDDLVIVPGRGLILGAWDDEDENPALPAGLGSVALSDAFGELCAGGLYVAIHTVADPAGAIRGQIEPVGKLCEKRD